MGKRAVIKLHSTSLFYNEMLTFKCLSQVFLGNANDYGILKQELSQEINARYVRFLPATWFSHVCMKVELDGYQGMN